MRVAAATSVAQAPWWVIGSAAARLHGAAADVHDVDVLIDAADADAVAARIGIDLPPGPRGALFRSARFGGWTPDDLTIEFMAVLEVRAGESWVPVQLRSRERRGGVFVPERGELVALLRLFGRDKDLARAAALERLGQA